MDMVMLDVLGDEMVEKPLMLVVFIGPTPDGVGARRLGRGGQRDSATAGQRDSGTAGQRDSGTAGQRDSANGQRVRALERK